ncbi:MAG: hypothetical protein GY861_05795 [bacterium]|nr:hypothetical protein [bacterium]
MTTTIIAIATIATIAIASVIGALAGYFSVPTRHCGHKQQESQESIQSMYSGSDMAQRIEAISELDTLSNNQIYNLLYMLISPESWQKKQDNVQYWLKHDHEELKRPNTTEIKDNPVHAEGNETYNEDGLTPGEQHLMDELFPDKPEFVQGDDMIGELNQAVKEDKNDLPTVRDKRLREGNAIYTITSKACDLVQDCYIASSPEEAKRRMLDALDPHWIIKK